MQHNSCSDNRYAMRCHNPFVHDLGHAEAYQAPAECQHTVRLCKLPMAGETKLPSATPQAVPLATVQLLMAAAATGIWHGSQHPAPKCYSSMQQDSPDAHTTPTLAGQADNPRPWSTKRGSSKHCSTFCKHTCQHNHAIKQSAATIAKQQAVCYQSLSDPRH